MAVKMNQTMRRAMMRAGIAIIIRSYHGWFMNHLKILFISDEGSPQADGFPLRHLDGRMVHRKISGIGFSGDVPSTQT